MDMDPTPHTTSYVHPYGAPPRPAPKFMAGLLGGLFIGVLSALPFISVANCCCLWVITGGMIAAWVMQQNHPLPVTVGEGAAVGLLAGLVGGFVSYLLSIPVHLFLDPIVGGFSEEMMRTSRRDMPPEVRHFMERLGPQSLLFLSALVWSVVCLFAGTFGGMLGAVFFRKPMPPAPPPLPPPAQAWTPPGF